MHATKTQRTAAISMRLLSHVDPSYPRVAETLRLLDAERVSSVPGILGSLEASRAAARSDVNLSAVGQREKIAAAAGSALGNIATVAKRVTEMEREHAAELAASAPLPEPTPSDTLIDLELARQIKAESPIPSKLERSSERVRVALARLPNELSGITSDVQARVRASLRDPALAARLGDEAAALEAARRVVQGAIDEVQADAQVGASELVRLFGTAWKLPGVAGTLADRLEAEQQADPATTE